MSLKGTGVHTDSGAIVCNMPLSALVVARRERPGAAGARQQGGAHVPRHPVAQLEA